MIVVILFQWGERRIYASRSNSRHRQLRGIHAGNDVLKLMISQRRLASVPLDDSEITRCTWNPRPGSIGRSKSSQPVLCTILEESKDNIQRRPMDSCSRLRQKGSADGRTKWKMNDTLIKEKALDSLVQLVESVRDPLDHRDTKLLTQCRDVMIPDPSEWFWIFLEGQVRGAPFLEQFWQGIRRLSPYHEQSGVQFSQGTVKVLQALQQKPVEKSNGESFRGVSKTHAASPV